MNWKILFGIVCLAVLVTGCGAWESAKSKVLGEDETITEEPFECDCPDCDTPEPGKVVYFFTNHKAGLLNTLDYADEYIFCFFPSLHDEDIVRKLILMERRAEVRVVFDESRTFDCEPNCIPKLASSYNSLLAQGFDIQVKSLEESYCVTEDGVFFYSGSFDQFGVDEAHVFYDEDMAEIYRKHFLGVWNT